MARRRGRFVPILLAALVMAAGCTDDDDDEGAGTTSTAGPTTTTLPPAIVSEPGPIEGCDGIGPAPTTGEVTWVTGGRLLAINVDGEAPVRCLIGIPRGQAAPVWNALADRVLAPVGGARVGDVTERLPVGSGEAEWSYPSGTSLVAASDGKLRKVKVADGTEADISFLTRHDEVVYHPGGRYVFSAGTDGDERLGIHLATNTGQNPRPVVEGETAAKIHSLAFNRNTLLFVAEHPDDPSEERHHLHYREDVPDAPLAQVTVPGGPVERMVASPFGPDEFYAAVQQGSCPSGRTAATVDLAAVKPDAPEFRTVDVGTTHTEVVGWLPGGRLVVIGRATCGRPGSLWVVPLAGGEPKRVADGVESAAVRVVIPRDGVADVPVEAMGEGSPPVA